MKPFIITLSSLCILKLASLAYIFSQKEKYDEINQFILEESTNRPDNYYALIGFVKDLTRQNSESICQCLINMQEDCDNKLHNFKFYTISDYYDFLKSNTDLIQTDPTIDLKTIPDSLRFILAQLKATNIILDVYQANQWEQGHDDYTIKGIINNISEENELLKINIFPFMAYNFPKEDKHNEFKVIIKPDSAKYYTNPLYYTGDLKNVTYLIINKISGEIFSFKKP